MATYFTKEGFGRFLRWRQYVRIDLAWKAHHAHLSSSQITTAIIAAAPGSRSPTKRREAEICVEPLRPIIRPWSFVNRSNIDEATVTHETIEHYRITAKLREDGMLRVYRATNTKFAIPIKAQPGWFGSPVYFTQVLRGDVVAYPCEGRLSK